jgi:hypothetical protein
MKLNKVYDEQYKRLGKFGIPYATVFDNGNSER